MKSSGNRKKSVFKAFGVISSMTFLSRITGYVRDAFIAAFIGASSFSDAFFVAFRIPNMFRRLLGEGALTPAIVPVVSGLARKDETERNEGIRSIISASSLIVLIVTVLGIIFSPYLVKLMAYGFVKNEEIFSLTVSLNRLMFPYLFFISMVAVYMGILNAHHHFFAPSFSPVLLNLSMIFGLVALNYFVGVPVYALAWGVILGGVAQFLFQIPYLKKEGIPFLPGLKLKTEATTDVLKIVLPSVFGLAITQINVLVNTLVASFLQEGTVSYLYYADRLIELPIGIFTISLATAILPTVSQRAAENDNEGVKRNFSRTFVFCMFFILPAMFFLICLGKPVLSVLFARKAFDINALNGTYLALMGYCWGLPFFSFNRLITPVFYAYKKTRDPVKAGFAAMTVNIVLNVALMRFGAIGLASATSASAIVNGYFLLRLFKSNHFDMEFGAPLKNAAPIFIAAFLAGGITYVPAMNFPYNNPFAEKVLYLAGFTALFGCLYVIFLKLLKVDEINEVWKILKEKSAKKQQTGNRE